jgi:hypothetical protein
MTACAEINLTHLGEDGGIFEAADVNPGASSEATSNGSTGRRDRGDCEAGRLLV